LVVRPQAYLALNEIDANYNSSDGVEFMVNNGVVYSNATIMAMMGAKATYAERSLTGGYAAPFIFQGPGSTVSYDTRSGSFVSGQAALLGGSLAPVAGDDLGKVNMEMVYADYSFGSDHSAAAATFPMLAVFRDGANYWLQVLDFRTNSLLFKADISSFTGIAQASSFAVPRRNPSFYYASGSTLYQVRYNFVGKTVEDAARVAWDGLEAGETITAIKLCPNPGSFLESSARERYMFVASWNESTQEGKVYTLKVAIETNGAIVDSNDNARIDAEPVAVYGGFGKIKSFGYKF
jgi:hypothetical protein